MKIVTINFNKGKSKMLKKILKNRKNGMARISDEFQQLDELQVKNLWTVLNGDCSNLEKFIPKNILDQLHNYAGMRYLQQLASNHILEGYGVEHIKADLFSCDYINMGEAYVTTILWPIHLPYPVIACYADFVDQYTKLHKKVEY